MTTSLTIRGGQLPDPNEWRTLMEMADVFIKSGLLPDAIKSPAAAVLVMQKGRELGIQPLYALSNIAIVKGKPAASAELMLALIYRDHGDDAMRFTETTAVKCTVSYKRRSWSSREQYSFTFADAETAGITGNATWKNYRPAMLRARCISAVARMAFPDTIGGLYTPEELGGSVGLGELEEPTIHVPQTVIPANADTGEIEERPTGEASRSARVAALAKARPPILEEPDPWDDAPVMPPNGPPDQRELDAIQERELAEMGQQAPAPASANGVTSAQLRAIYAIARGSKGLNEAQIEAMCKSQYRAKPGELTRKQASDFITALQGQEATK